MARKGENIYKRKDGRWEARCITFYDEAGRAHYKSDYGKSYAEAKSKKQALCISVKTTDVKSMVKESCTFESICRQWLKYAKPHIKESTYVKYRGMLENHIIPLLGQYEPDQLTMQVLEQYFAGLLDHGRRNGKGLSAKSTADIKSVIKMTLIYAEHEGWIQNSYISHISIKQEYKPVRVLEKQEQVQLEQYLLADISYIHIGIYVCLYMGIRLGELCALKWKAIDFNTKLLSIELTMLRIKDYTADGGKKTKIIESPPKSACSVRKIPIPDFLLQMLKQKSVGMQSQAYLLTGRSDKYIEPRIMEYHFRKITASCGIVNANFHCLRHTFATRCVELKFDAKTLSEILGHSSIGITMNRYVHPSMDLKRISMEKLEKLSECSK